MLKLSEAIDRRFRAAVKIQSSIRRYLHSKIAMNLRILMQAACLTIQRHIRGHFSRWHLRQKLAALRIQKFMKKIHFFRFKDAVIMIMQLRSYFKRRNLTAVTLQRVFRGFSVRLDLFRGKLLDFMKKRSSKIICKAIFQFELILRKRKVVIVSVQVYV